MHARPASAWHRQVLKIEAAWGQETASPNPLQNQRDKKFVISSTSWIYRCIL